MKHTKEPWSCVFEPKGDHSYDCWLIKSSDDAGFPDEWIVADVAGCLPGDDSGEIHARRIVAAVNAVAGIPTKALEDGVIGEMPKIIKGLLADPNSIIRHAARDTLAKLKERG